MSKRICWSSAIALAAFAFTLAAVSQSRALEPIPEKDTSASHSFVAPDTGAELYADYCVSCHGEDGKGGPAAAAMDPPPPDLTDAERMGALSDEELLEVISSGKGTMPGVGSTLEPEELEALVEYVRGLSAEKEGEH